KDERVAIIVAYDKALLRALEALNQQGYKGEVYATTTLSVKDWQEYIRNEGSIDPGIKLYYTYVKRFNMGKTLFANKLGPWTFDTVIAQNGLDETLKFYCKTPDIIEDEEWFDELEKKVYKKIYPNYISAFCFDSVRLFSKMWDKPGKYPNLRSMLEERPLLCWEHSPFSRMQFKSGKTNASVDIMVFDLDE
ncbi:hypothetical protein LCGC14_3093870, partial [marine sediment metagenome]